MAYRRHPQAITGTMGGKEGWLAGGWGVARQEKAGREEGVWAGREKLAGRRVCGQCKGCHTSCHAIALHVVPYIPYIQPLDAQFGVGVKKIGSWPQNLAERRADKI